jgi:hypothetical protein
MNVLPIDYYYKYATTNIRSTSETFQIYKVSFPPSSLQLYEWNFQSRVSATLLSKEAIYCWVFYFHSVLRKIA